MFRIPIWNKSGGHSKSNRFCDALVENDQILIEIKFGRNNFQQMPCEEIQKQIMKGIKKEKEKSK